MVAKLEVNRQASSTNVHGLHARWYNVLAADKRNMGWAGWKCECKKRPGRL